jgi:predicted RNA-binding protein
MKFWVSSGSPENWKVGIERGGVWAVNPKLKDRWKRLSPGDVLVFYATHPISGIIGIGRIKKIEEGDKPIWPEEIQRGKAIWRYRFWFDILHKVEPEKWKEQKIFVKDLRVSVRAGLDHLSSDVMSALIQRADALWETNLHEQVKVEIKPEKPTSLHNKIRDMLYEVGKLENRFPEREYNVDGKLDVIWRRTEKSVPSHAFEVQVGGDVYHALAKLKHAFDMWNSKLFLVITEKDRETVHELLGGSFHEIRSNLKVVMVDKVEHLYQIQVEDRRLRTELGIDDP